MTENEPIIHAPVGCVVMANGGLREYPSRGAVPPAGRTVMYKVGFEGTPEIVQEYVPEFGTPMAIVAMFAKPVVPFCPSRKMSTEGKLVEYH